jgi:hypothetical protein
MRSATISRFALLASSLLVKEALALPIRVSVRDLYVETDNVVVTEEVSVFEETDGSYETEAPNAIGTSTIPGSASLVPQTTPSAAATTSIAAATSTSIPIYVPSTQSVSSATSSSSTSAVVAQEAAPVSIVTPTTTSTPKVAVPTTTSTTPIPVAATTTAAPVVVPTTSSVAPVATTSASSSTSSSNKRGLAYNDASILSGFVSGSSKVSWAYNWGSTTSTIASGLEYIPMLWGLLSADTSNWSSAATKAIASGSTALLAFNEPDLAAQANLGYADAAAGYLTYMEPFAGKAKLVAPAVTNGGSPMGLTWLGNFIEACSTCTIDAIALHWYNGGTADDFKTYITTAYAAGGNRPIWVTEFQASGTDADQQTFLQDVMAWMDDSTMVERYAYFMASDGILLSSGSTLSALGSTFASA